MTQDSGPESVHSIDRMFDAWLGRMSLTLPGRADGHLPTWSGWSNSPSRPANWGAMPEGGRQESPHRSSIV
jgi:hypothetical protein